MRDSEVLVVFKLTEILRSCSKRIINIFHLSQLMIKLPMESFYIFIWIMLKNILFIKILLFWEKKKSEIKFKFWTFDLTCHIWNTVNTNWRMKYFFLILAKYNRVQIQQLQHWYNKCNSKEICQSARNGRAS